MNNLVVQDTSGNLWKTVVTVIGVIVVAGLAGLAIYMAKFRNRKDEKAQAGGEKQRNASPSIFLTFFHMLSATDVVILLVLIAIPTVFAYRFWSKQNLILGNTRVIRAELEKKIRPALVELKEQGAKPVLVQEKPVARPVQERDSCIDICTPEPKMVDGHPLLDDLQGDLAFFEGVCSGSPVCSGCSPSAPKRETEPKPVCRHKKAQP